MDDAASQCRHAVLGAANALKLGAAALQIPMSVPEQLEFLDDLLTSSDRLISLLDEFDSLAAATPVG